jgi:hypothetical protein
MAFDLPRVIRYELLLENLAAGETAESQTRMSLEGLVTRRHPRCARVCRLSTSGGWRLSLPDAVVKLVADESVDRRSREAVSPSAMVRRRGARTDHSLAPLFGGAKPRRTGPRHPPKSSRVQGASRRRDGAGARCDVEVLNLANHETTTFLTADKDCGELVFRQKQASQGVVLS